ncbi:MAG: hypothetical protein PHX21_11830 [bacterium]|nr:hypothetical protein [bacterium]
MINIFRNFFKLTFFILGIVAFIPLCVMAEGIDLNNLKAPSSPGFVLLGVEPTSVESPNNLKTFALNLISSSMDAGFIPQSYAVEVAPYWLSSHPTLTFKDYYNANLKQRILQTTSLSLATSKLRSEMQDSIGTSLGLGLRTDIFSGKASKRLSSYVDSLKKIQEDVVTTEDSSEEKRLGKESQRIALEIQKENKNRVGNTVELAGALVADFPENNFDKEEITKFGTWITWAYNWEKPTIDAIFVARYIFDREKENNNVFDLGGRILWQSSRFELSTELVGRLGENALGKNDIFYRLVGTFEYCLTENVYLTTSFGRNYDMDKTGKGTLIAIIETNFGFGTPKLGF